MNYADFMAAMRHRWKLVLGCLMATLLVIAVWTFFSPRIYASSATLLFDSLASEAEGGAGAAPPMAMASVLGTQADIIRSALVASQVVRNLELEQSPAVIARWTDATGGRGDINSWLVNSLLTNLTVVPTRNTNVMAVQYQASDPEFAALVTNGFADAFVKTQLRLRTEPAKVYSDWFQDRTRDVRARYEETQARLTRFQQEKGLIGGEKLDVELSHLAELSNQLAAAEGAAADARARAAGGGAMSPEVQSAPGVVGVRAAVVAKAAEVQQLETTLGPNHPQLITARAALGVLNSELNQAVAAATRSLQVASSAAQLREAELRERLAAQRQQVLKLSGVQDQLAVLQRDVDAAKLAYDNVTQQLNGARLKSEIPQTNVSILDRAGVPFYPVSPNVALRLILGLLLGLGIGIGLAALLEWLSPRVRSSAGLRDSVGLSTLVDLDEHRRSRNQQARGAAA
ncbi:hypothetical protein CLG96_07385 [Sphingomonas oleivorans]|uniref:Chain length determinant protein EpsF n=1 Tax=Sphingomonas oleivorans TaxID=1735121 RepID=A0A2T5G0A4_9SPHN|nr:GNVR domain-containing protein [Sphingomonas oleivorans]PTQ12347.1 hypothetical protein CLG96_07385 [Sphingomonas oleivorans]